MVRDSDVMFADSRQRLLRSTTTPAEKPRPIRPLVFALVLCASASGLAQTMQGPPGAPEVRVAASAQAPGPQAGGTPAQAGGWHYMVRSGDTLDRIIAQTQAASPFSLAFLREALARANPAALPKGPQGPLLAGSLLRIPSAAELRRMAFPELEADATAPSAARQASAEASAPAALSAARRAELEQRTWVRFP